jgi:hypothetical protein
VGVGERSFSLEVNKTAELLDKWMNGFLDSAHKSTYPSIQQSICDD